MAVLSQKGEDGFEYPIAYASRKTNKAEQGYISYELETLSIVWALKVFRHYILARDSKFIVRTDCKAVTWMLHSEQKENNRIQPYINALLEYDKLSIQFRKGLQNTADYKSRNPLPVDAGYYGEQVVEPLYARRFQSLKELVERDLPFLLGDSVTSTIAYVETNMNVGECLYMIWDKVEEQDAFAVTREASRVLWHKLSSGERKQFEDSLVSRINSDHKLPFEVRNFTIPGTAISMNGVFATEDLVYKDNVTGYYYKGVELDKKTKRIVKSSGENQYLYKIHSNLYVDGADCRVASFTRFINGTGLLDKANVRIVVDGHNRLELESLRPIKKGEQILLDYQKDYWKNRVRLNLTVPNVARSGIDANDLALGQGANQSTVAENKDSDSSRSQDQDDVADTMDLGLKTLL